jgi:hypothetical protein
MSRAHHARKVRPFFPCVCAEMPRTKFCVFCRIVLEESVADVMIEMLTKWFSLTRLETRTKESNLYASIWV